MSKRKLHFKRLIKQGLQKGRDINTTAEYVVERTKYSDGNGGTVYKSKPVKRKSILKLFGR